MTRLLRATALVVVVIGVPSISSAQPPSPGKDIREEVVAGDAAETPPHTAQQMSEKERMGGMQGMACTCPSALQGAAGILILALSAVVAASAAATLIALAVFLLRRSRRESTP
jgi:hypothetical protein